MTSDATADRAAPRAWLGRTQHLAARHRASTPEEVAQSVIALHSSDPASVYLGVAARTRAGGAPPSEVERALYTDRSLVTIMGMRRTLWVVPAELVPIVDAACGRAVAADQRRKLVAAVEAQGLTEDGATFVEDLAQRTLEALAACGDARTSELAHVVPGLQAKVRFGGTSKWAGDFGLSTRIILVLLCERRIVRMKPEGSWTSTRHRYAVAPPTDEQLPTADAQVALARRWLDAFGPASDDVVADLRWWAGWSLAATTRAIAATGWEPPPAPRRPQRPWVALLPSLDSTTMGWKQRSWYVGELAPLVFDRNGNAGATIWFDGRIVGAWGQRPNGEVATRLLVDIGADGSREVDAEVARLQDWLDASGAVVKARFPSPLQRELSS